MDDEKLLKLSQKDLRLSTTLALIRGSSNG